MERIELKLILSDRNYEPIESDLNGYYSVPLDETFNEKVAALMQAGLDTGAERVALGDDNTFAAGYTYMTVTPDDDPNYIRPWTNSPQDMGEPVTWTPGDDWGDTRRITQIMNKIREKGLNAELPEKKDLSFLHEQKPIKGTLETSQVLRQTENFHISLESLIEKLRGHNAIPLDIAEVIDVIKPSEKEPIHIIENLDILPDAYKPYDLDYNPEPKRTTITQSATIDGSRVTVTHEYDSQSIAEYGMPTEKEAAASVLERYLKSRLVDAWENLPSHFIDGVSGDYEDTTVSPVIHRCGMDVDSRDTPNGIHVATTNFGIDVWSTSDGRTVIAAVDGKPNDWGNMGMYEIPNSSCIESGMAIPLTLNDAVAPGQQNKAVILCYEPGVIGNDPKEVKNNIVRYDLAEDIEQDFGKPSRIEPLSLKNHLETAEQIRKVISEECGKQEPDRSYTYGDPVEIPGTFDGHDVIVHMQTHRGHIMNSKFDSHGYLSEGEKTRILARTGELIDVRWENDEEYGTGSMLMKAEEVAKTAQETKEYLDSILFAAQEKIANHGKSDAQKTGTEGLDL